MAIYTENNLQFDFSNANSARKFDEEYTLSHCMKAVDFIIIDGDTQYFIEVKDLDHPDNPDIHKHGKALSYLKKIKSELVKKYRDTFLYLWAENATVNNITYLILLSCSVLDEAELGAFDRDLKIELPVSNPWDKNWRRKIAQNCQVLSFEAWNKHLSQFPVSKIS